jgi:pyridoxamine 5'-phosphate oxidase
MDKAVMDEIEALVAASRDIMVCSLDENGYPNVKAMFKSIHDGLKTFYFSTNTSSMRTQQFMHCPKASLYFHGPEQINGLMLVGDMEVLSDVESKRKLWHEGDERYYPLGPTDPDYSVLRFTARTGNYYHALRKHLFGVE